MKFEMFWFWLAFHLPVQLVFYATVRLVALASTGKYSDTVMGELTAIEALKRFSIDHLNWGKE